MVRRINYSWSSQFSNNYSFELKRECWWSFFSFFFQTLYGQLRQLVKYVKEYCGGTFYRVVFGGLLKSTGKPEKRLQGTTPEQKIAQAAMDAESLSTPKSLGTEKIVTPKNSRKLFFPKFSRSGSSTDGSPTGNVEFGFDSPTTPLSRKKVLYTYKFQTWLRTLLPNYTYSLC